MKVIIDTSVWSEALRKKRSANKDTISELIELIKELRVIMIGPIRQELLSGISDKTTFNKLKEKLSFFEDLHLQSDYFEFAAELSNRCRKKGVQGSHTDFLICAISLMNDFPIFTLDKDFLQFKKHLDIILYDIRKEY